jgi:D-alanyl-D-alanine carboxypeptidase
MFHVLRRLAWISLASFSSLLGCTVNEGESAREPANTGAPSGGEIVSAIGGTAQDSTAMTATACGALSVQLQAALDKATKAQKIPGATAAVDHAGCAWRGASGVSNLPAKIAAYPGDLFHLGSITKTFTAALLLKLRAEGKVSLDSPVATYVADVPRGDVMTVRQLLNHTSGLFDYSECDDFWNTVKADPHHVWKPADLVALAATKQPYFEPGQGWEYSNSDYIVAGMIVEKVSGEPAAAALRSRILDPEKLGHTYLDGYEPPVPGLIHGYETDGKDFLDVTWTEDPSWAWTAGGLVSNVDDLTKFSADLLDGKVLAPAELQEMTTMVSTTWPSIPEYGLGLAERKFDGKVGLGHEGGVWGFVSASFKFTDPAATVSVLINLESGDAARIVGDLVKVLQAP